MTWPPILAFVVLALVFGVPHFTRRVLFASANLYMLARAGGSLHPDQDFCAL